MEVKMTITLWGRLSAINVQKVVWLLGELGLAHEHIPLGGKFGGLDDPAYLKLNPNGFVPTLRDGNLVLWESHAIVRYLAATYGAGTWWPVDPLERALSDQWMDWTATSFQTAWLGVFELVVRTPVERHDAGRIAAATARAERLFAMLDAQLAGQDYLGGEMPTYADIGAGVSLYRWMTMDIERAARPNVEVWYQRLVARPAYQQAVCLSYAELVGNLPLH
jgi:glutathione S-transferase